MAPALASSNALDELAQFFGTTSGTKSIAGNQPRHFLDWFCPKAWSARVEYYHYLGIRKPPHHERHPAYNLTQPAAERKGVTSSTVLVFPTESCMRCPTRIVLRVTYQKANNPPWIVFFFCFFYAGANSRPSTTGDGKAESIRLTHNVHGVNLAQRHTFYQVPRSTTC